MHQPRTARRTKTFCSLRGERGAISVFGLFSAILMAAAVFYFAGIADAVLRVERAQDAADSAAFSDAAMRARGMNALALTNLVSSALLSVAAALRVIEVLSTVGVAVLSVTGQLAHPQALLSVAEFEALRQQVRTSGAYLNAAEQTRIGLQTLDEVSRVVRVTVPWSADRHVIDHALMHYAPEVGFGTALPARPSLPVRMEGGVSLCERVDSDARQAAFGVVTALLPPGLTPAQRALLPTYDREQVLTLMRTALDQLGAIPGYACRDDAPAPATIALGPIPQTLVPAAPLLLGASACLTYATGPDGVLGTGDDPAVYSADQHRAVCAEAWVDAWESWPDERNFSSQTSAGALDDGSCRAGQRVGGGDSPQPSAASTVQCGAGSAWEERIRAARAQCDPRGRADRFVAPGRYLGLCNGSSCVQTASAFGYFIASVEHTYRYTGSAWEEMPELRRDVVPPSSAFASDGVLPCGTPSASVGPEWNSAPYDARGYAAPVCREARPAAPPVCPLTPGDCPPASPRAGALYTQVVREVPQVVFCGTHGDLVVPLPPATRTRGLGEIRSRVVVLEPTVMLGDDDFQARAAAFWPVPRFLPGGSGDARRNYPAEQIATLVRPVRDARYDFSWGTIRNDAIMAEGVATAQAEVFYDVGDGVPLSVPELRTRQTNPAERASWLWRQQWGARLTGFHDLTSDEFQRLTAAQYDPELRRILPAPVSPTIATVELANLLCLESAGRNGRDRRPCDWVYWRWAELTSLSTH